MSPELWRKRAAEVAPMLNYAAGVWGGEAGIIEKIFSILPVQSGFAVEFGQKVPGRGTVAELIEARRWNALYMDRDAPTGSMIQTMPGGNLVTVAQERVGPSNINDLFAKYAVPGAPDCLVIDIDGLDYWVWRAISQRYRPALVIIEFNAHVAPGVQATIAADEGWSYHQSKDYGASFSALCALAAEKGYSLLHVHGPWNLYFTRSDLDFPAELRVSESLSQHDFGLLTDTQAFYDSLCGDSSRPTWFGTLPPDVSRPPWELLGTAESTSVVDLDGLQVEVLADMHDPTWYQQRSAFEEKASSLYELLGEEGFVNFVDIGANVGFVTVLAELASPGIRGIAAEADPRLAKLLRGNLERHGMADVEVVNAIVGDTEDPAATFSLNPSSTLDNRVRMDGWPEVCIPVIRMDRVLRELDVTGKTFFKIDTQGFELNVLRGLEDYLHSQVDWLIKMEFAPEWLRSQGTDPVALLAYLEANYSFAELPARVPFRVKGFDALFGAPIEADQHEEFLAYVTSLDRDGRGWVDLLVRPRGRKRPVPGKASQPARSEH